MHKETKKNKEEEERITNRKAKEGVLPTFVECWAKKEYKDINFWYKTTNTK